jgi:hypothetical protein
VTPPSSSTVGGSSVVGGGVATGGATGGASAGIDVDTRAPGTDAVSSATSEASRAQGATSATGRAESTVGGVTEPADSARGKVTGAASVDVSAEAQSSANQRVSEARAAGPQRPDPEAEARVRFSEQDQAVGSARAKGDEAQRVGADPRGAATARVEGEAVGRVEEASPVDPGAASAKVDVATGTVRDPSGTARSRVDSAVEEKKSDAKADVGISADVKVSTDPTKK